MYDPKKYRQERDKLRAEIVALLTPEDKTWADQIRAKQAAYEALPNGKKNEIEELDVFKAFEAFAAVGIDSGSWVNAPSPEPDIRCASRGEGRYFELGEITDPRVARCAADSLKYDEQTVTAFSQDGPLEYIIRKKSTRKYATGGVPVELVLYYQTQHAPPDWYFAHMLARNMAALEGLVASGLFQRVWIFDFVKKRILWRS
jgi:hypothetical protein